MARLVMIANPVAARHTPAMAETVLRVFRAAGWAADLLETQRAEDARRFSAEAVAAGADVVAVFGGDGTTMQAAVPLVGTGIPLGLVPGGTGNVLAGNLGLPLGPVQAAQVILGGRTRRIDLGRLERPDGVHYFGVACGAGADARIMGGTATAAKRRLGVGGYFGSLFREMQRIGSTRFKVTVDDIVLDYDASVCLVLNCGVLIPPLVRAHPTATLDDGVFDVMLMRADSAWQVVRGMTRAFANVVLETGETAYLHYARGSRVTIETDRPEPVQYDGDVAGETPVTAEMAPAALTVMTG